MEKGQIQNLNRCAEGDQDAPRFDDENLSVEDRRRMNRRTVDGSMTFALLLYVNIFYFALYAGVELFLLIFKAYNMTDHPKHAYSPTDLVNELAILAFMVVVESARLVLGNKHDLVRKIYTFLLGIGIMAVHAEFFRREGPGQKVLGGRRGRRLTYSVKIICMISLKSEGGYV